MAEASTRKSVCVLVLGDLGHSPRMQYHATSLTREGFDVDFVAYGGSRPHKDILENPHIRMHLMPDLPNFSNWMPRLLSYVAKAIWQSIILFFFLLFLERPSHILVQNPPAIPSLAVAWIVSLLKWCHLVIDWHNYGYTILSMTLSDSHPLVLFSRWYEGLFGRMASANLCVSRAMQNDLYQRWHVKATVVYDRPAEIFQTITVEEKHTLFKRLSNEYPVFSIGTKYLEYVDQTGTTLEEKDQYGSVVDHKKDGITMFTEKLPTGEIEMREGRPALLVSSTSWSEDEDFSLLLMALELYDKQTDIRDNNLPDIVCVITGKGPLKSYYTDLIRNKLFRHVQFCLPWLTAEDYPKLLAAADLGVCLHTSSSGLDLPMKVVDMFGCGLPVCAVNFNCVQELVVNGQNGLIFETDEELARHLQSLLGNFSSQPSRRLQLFRDNLQEYQTVRWHAAWKTFVLPIFQ